MESNVHLSDPKPIKIQKLDTDEFTIPQHNLNNYSCELEKGINEPALCEKTNIMVYLLFNDSDNFNNLMVPPLEMQKKVIQTLEK